MSVEVKVVRLPHAEGLDLPGYASEGAAGADLRAAVEDVCVLQPGERAAVPTGLVFEIPPGFEAQVRPRSGLALKQGLTVANAPGTIDSDYRGEVKAIVVNLGREPVTIRRGDRIAQIIVAPVVQARYCEVETLAPSGRGEGGFGSTGR